MVAKQVYGRLDAVTLVRALMERPLNERGRPTTTRSPVIVLEAPAGGGKTALLEAMAELLHQRVPYAFVDLATVTTRADRDATVTNLLSALAFELSRRCQRYGTLRFPRFVVGQLVMRLDLSRDDPGLARKQATDALKAHRRLDQMLDILEEAAGTATGLTPIQPQIPSSMVRGTLSLLVDGMTRWLPRLTLGRFQDWYGHRDRGLQDDPISTLVGLNRWAHSHATGGAQRRIDNLMSAAFLADLRHGFASSRRSAGWSLNCVALLDNADSDLARDLLETLVRVRGDDLDHGYAAPDPLTIVATSGGRLLAKVNRADQVALSVPLVDNYKALDRRVQPWWLRCRLDDLTVDEVNLMVTDLSLDRDDDHQLAALIHQFTGGHPGATRIMLEAITAITTRWRSLAEVLGGDSGGVAVEERLLQLFLDGVPDEAREDLITCSAARTRHHAIELAVRRQDLFTAPDLVIGELRESPMWLLRDEWGPTVLRRLLLRRLAGRRDGAATWSVVHRWLREASPLEHRDERDTRTALTAELAYALADGDIEFVTRKLDQHAVGRATTWLAMVDAVTSVPGRLDPYVEHTVQARGLTSWLGSGDERQLACIAGLVARLWIAADPFRDIGRRGLHRQIARDYDELALYHPEWDDELYTQKNRHQQLARVWSAGLHQRETP